MVTNKLVKLAKETFKSKERGLTHFLDNEEQDKLLNDIENYPHAFVLACIMDKQIKAERAWEIPYKIYKELGNFDIDFLASIPKERFIRIFIENSYHRFNEREAKNFYKAIQRIKNQYNGDASKIWEGKPSSATIVYRFLEFEGVGIKIATMAANILARQFKIKFKDYYSVDISPDVHVRRVLKRMGYFNGNPTIDQIIYKAREISPQFPGLIDYSCWEIGRTYCHKNKPDCDNCPVKDECEKKIEKVK